MIVYTPFPWSSVHLNYVNEGGSVPPCDVRVTCICGSYDWSHAPVLFATLRAGTRPVILILRL